MKRRDVLWALVGLCVGSCVRAPVPAPVAVQRIAVFPPPGAAASFAWTHRHGRCYKPRQG